MNETIIEDIHSILSALELGNHSRSYSPHEVIEREIIPAIKRLKERGEKESKI